MQYRPAFERLETRDAPAVLPPVITTSQLSNWTVNQPGYNQFIDVEFGQKPYLFTVPHSGWSSPLPPGLTLINSRGEISGTPTAVGSYSFTVYVTDSLGQTAYRNYTVAITVPQLQILSTQLGDWTVNQPGYQQYVYISGGVGPYQFFTDNPNLIPGLSLDENTGVLSGRPTQAGTYLYPVHVLDALGDAATRYFPIAINPRPHISTRLLPDGAVGTVYLGWIGLTGGTGGEVLSVTGALPPGLGLYPSGALYGTPTTAGTYSFFVIATDGTAAQTWATITVTIDTPLPLAPLAQPLAR